VSFYLKVIGTGSDPIPGPWREPYAEFTPTHPPDNSLLTRILEQLAPGTAI
jgi:hypothetical protein